MYTRICMQWVSNLPLFQLNFGIVPAMWYFFAFHFISSGHYNPSYVCAFPVKLRAYKSYSFWIDPNGTRTHDQSLSMRGR
jgi:hypothetical protein